jgi:predicted DNA-binding transcriptional regulator YafY
VGKRSTRLLAKQQRTRSPADDRLLKLPWLMHALLTRPGGVGAREILTTLRVKERALRKYVDLLSGFPAFVVDGQSLVEWSGAGRDRVLRLREPPAARAPTELVARLGVHHLTTQVLGFLGGASLDRAVKSAQAEFLRSTQRFNRDGTVAHVVKNLSRLFHFRADAGTKDYTGKRDVLEALVDALSHCSELAFDYVAIGAERKKHTDIQPLTLCVWQGGLYLLARFRSTRPRRVGEEPRTYVFVVDRIEAVRKTGRNFAYPAEREYSLERLFDGVWGMFVPPPGKRKSVVVDLRLERIDWIERYVQERTWSKTQTLTREPDGRLRLCFHTTTFVELVPWLWCWGEGIEVVGPPELRALMQQTLPPDGRRPQPGTEASPARHDSSKRRASPRRP